MADTTPSPTGPETPGFVRAISRWDLTAAIVNGVIGSAIFGAPATLAALTGALSPLGYALALLPILTIVLCFAEVASRFRDAGGPYLYCREAFGHFAGFQAGWLTFWTRVLSGAANLNVFATYLAQIMPAAGSRGGRLAAMTAVMALVTAINLIGVRQASWTVDLFTVAKLTPLVLLIGLGIFRLDRDVMATQSVPHADWTQAVLLIVFAYGGFEAPLIPAAEARDPRRDSGFALLVALLVVAVVYTLVQLVVVGIVPRVAGEAAPVAAAFARLIGPIGVTLACVGAMISTYGWTMGSVLQAPRLLFSMADRGELPRRLAWLHPRFRTPQPAILLYAAVALGLAAYGSFAWNAVLSAIVRLIIYGATCIALLVFRRRKLGAPGFRVPAAWLVVPAGALFCVVLLLGRANQHAWMLAWIMAAGTGLWVLARRRGAR